MLFGGTRGSAMVMGELAGGRGNSFVINSIDGCFPVEVGEAKWGLQSCTELDQLESNWSNWSI